MTVNTNKIKISDCNGTRTHNHLVRKRTLNHLAKLDIASDIASVSSKEFLDIQAAIVCGFTLKRVCGMIRTYIQDQDSYLSGIFCIEKVSQNYGITCVS